MYLRVPLHKYKLCGTYRYLSKSISSVTPMGDLDKYKYAISTRICISLLYEFMQIMISATVYLLLLYDYCKGVLMHMYTYKSYVSH